jgi:hypothetical protein
MATPPTIMAQWLEGGGEIAKGFCNKGLGATTVVASGNYKTHLENPKNTRHTTTSRIWIMRSGFHPVIFVFLWN